VMVSIPLSTCHDSFKVVEMTIGYEEPVRSGSMRFAIH